MKFCLGDKIKIKEGVKTDFYAEGDKGTIQVLEEGDRAWVEFGNGSHGPKWCDAVWLVSYEHMEKEKSVFSRSNLETISSRVDSSMATALAENLKNLKIPSSDIVLVDHMELTPTKPITTIEGAVERIKELQSEIIVNDEYARIRVAIIKDEIDRMLDLILELKEE